MFKFFFISVIAISAFQTRAQFSLSDWEKSVEFKKKETLTEVLSKAEKLFLVKLNDYRKTKKAQELITANEFELMALNHCIWMRHHDKLTHSQKTGSQFFSGATVSKRLAFVNETAKSSLLGENVAYIYLNSNDLSKPLDDLAEQIAQNFFENWKNSPPHKENMIEKGYKLTGVNFLIVDGKIFGTQVFSA